MNQNISSLSIDILDPYRRTVFDRLGALKSIGYLAGGTSLALQIRHRLSYDFDVFTTKKMTPGLREKIVDLFSSPLRFTMDTSDQLTWFDRNQVKVTIAYTSHPPLHPLVTSPSLSLCAIDDIASDKAFTIGRRGVWRDYVDLYCIVQAGKGLETIVVETKKRYNDLFEEKLFLEQLGYFDDLTEKQIEFIGTPISEDKIKQFLITTLKQYLKTRGASIP